MARQTIITFPNNDHATINSGFYSGKTVLEENLEADEQLNFTGCCANLFEATIANISDIKSKKISVSMLEDTDNTTTQLFTGYVDESTLQADRTYRKISALDEIGYKANKDVSGWYESVFQSAATVTLKAFRDSLFNYMGISQVSTTLLKDTMEVKHSQIANELKFIDVAKAICQANAVFGNMNRSGAFEYLDLATTDTRTINDNYKANDSKFEDFITKKIDKVQIRVTSDDVGAVYGTGTNALIIEGNMLFFGKTSTELQTIAYEIYNKVKDFQYTPCDFKLITSALNYRPGNKLTITTKNNTTINSLIMKNVLSGIQLFSQEFSSEGVEERSETVSTTNTQIMMLNQKMHEVVNNVEELSSTITEVSTNLDTLQDDIDTNYPTTEIMQSAINQKAGEISTSVSQGYEVLGGGRNYISGTMKDTYTQRLMGTVSKMVWEFTIADLGLVAGTDYITFSSMAKNLSTAPDNIMVRIDQYNSSGTALGASYGNVIIPGSTNWSKVTTKLSASCTTIKVGWGRTEPSNATNTTTTFLFNTRSEKLEKGQFRTDWCLSNEDMVTTQTKATQTSDKFTWLVSSGTSASNMVLTDALYSVLTENIVLAAKNINLEGYTTVNQYFKIDTAGRMQCTEGKIGPWNITPTALYDDDVSLALGIGDYGGTIKTYDAANSNVYTEISQGYIEAFRPKSRVRINRYSIVPLSVYDVENDKTTFSVASTGVIAHDLTFTTSYGSELHCDNIYNSSGLITSSDANLKKDIEQLGDNTIDFIMSLNPVKYKYINGTSGRTHNGLIAQEVETAMEENGMDSLDFAGFIKYQKTEEIEEETEDLDDNGLPLKLRKRIDVPGEYSYALRYEEFISPLIKTVQSQQKQIDDLKTLVMELVSKGTESAESED